MDFGNPNAVLTAAPAATVQPPGESFSQRVGKRLKALTGGWLGR
jgi:hypothetical protein